MDMLDDILYPLYMEYGYCRDNFYNNHIDDVREIFSNYSNGGTFWFKYTIAKNGDRCFAVSANYHNKLIKNSVGYLDENVALMSMVYAIKNDDFGKFN